MVFGVAKRLALLAVVVFSSLVVAASASADEGGSSHTSFDISWPQCPNNFPQERMDFAIIGLNGGRPFTSNPCFMAQYKWARTAEANPDVYINVDFPRAGLVEAMSGPYGRCAAEDDWCRGYNWGYNLAANSIARAQVYGITPGRYWLDVETDNYWSKSARNNSQVVRGVLDYFLANNVPTGIYSTYYQWELITGNYKPQVKLPLWVAGATSDQMAAERCSQSRFAFAGGEIWLVQFVRQYDQNRACKPMLESQAAKNARQPQASSAQPTPPSPAAASAPARDSAGSTGLKPLTAAMDAIGGRLFKGPAR